MRLMDPTRRYCMVMINFLYKADAPILNKVLCQLY